jgi:hypothetical protein
MTIAGTDTDLSFTGDGAVTTFVVTFPFFGTGATSEIEVISRVVATGVETVQTYSTHYTVTGGNGSTGTVEAGTAPASTVQWHIRRTTTQTQGTDYVENDEFPADSHEDALDRLTMVAQDQETQLAKSFRYPNTYTGGASILMPEPVADAFLLFNSAADGLTTTSSTAGQFLGGNGTVSLPYYSFATDPNSGVYRIGADNLGVAVNGAKVVDITTTGINSTVIGATTPAAGTFSSITSGGAVLSDTDSTDSLGSTGVRWLKLWVDSIQTTANTDIAGDLTVTGNLTVNGTTVTNDATNTEIKDPLIELNSGAGSNANDLGFIFERGSTGNNGFMGWDESGDYFTVGTTTATGSSTGNITYSFAPFKCSAITATSGTLAGLTSIAMAAGATLTAGFLDEDDMASDSAVAGVTQQSAKAYVDSSSKAAGISMTWETTTTDTDQGVGKVWANNATLSSATVLYFDDVERNSVSINALIDSLDDPTATNSATIYIQEAGTATAGVVFKCSGAVSSASTYSKVAVTHLATFGTLSDGDVVGVTFAFSGDNGGGMANIVEDSTPQLGGTLDLNGNTITGLVIGTNIQAYDADTVVADSAKEMTATMNFNATTLTDEATVAWATAANQVVSVTLGGNRALGAATGIVDGAVYILRVIQDGSGSRTLSWNAKYHFAGGTVPTLTTTAAAQDIFVFLSEGTNMKCVGQQLDVKTA